MASAESLGDTPRERTAYFDTANWAVLADGKLDARPLETAVASGAVVPVLSLTHLQEFGQRKPESRIRLTRFIDALRQRGTFLWISDLVTTERQELLVAFQRSIGVDVASWDPFGGRFFDCLPPAAALRGARADRPDMVEWATTILAESRNLANIRGRVDGFKAAFVKHTYERRQLVNSGADLPAFIRGQLPEELRLRSGVIVNPREATAFLNGDPRPECPAVRLRLHLESGNYKLTGTDKPSMAMDMFHVVGLAYCEQAFADARTCDALRKGGAAHDLRARVTPNGHFADWLSGLTTKVWGTPRQWVGPTFSPQSVS